MAFVAVAATAIAVDRPLTNELLTQYKDNDDYLYGQLSGLTAGLLNPSFEVDSDADGAPDSWTVSLYSGGAASLSTVYANHGHKAMKFTHPGGAGNGAGLIQSDYVPISSSQDWLLGFSIRSTIACHNKVQVNWYRADQTSLSNTTLADGNGVLGAGAINITADFVRLNLPVTIPTSARYAKITLVAGATDVNVAGDVYYDHLSFAPIETYAPGTLFLYQGNAPVDMSAASVATLGGDVFLRKGVVLVEYTYSYNVVGILSTISIVRNGSVTTSRPHGAGPGATGAGTGVFYVDVNVNDCVAVVVNTFGATFCTFAATIRTANNPDGY